MTGPLGWIPREGLAVCPRCGCQLELELWPPRGAASSAIVERCGSVGCTYLYVIAHVPDERAPRSFP